MTSQEREFNVMDKEELQELVSDLQKQLQEAQDKLENFAKNARFKPKRTEDYYYVEDDARICGTVFDNSYAKDVRRYETFNCFRTLEEAQKEANKILIRRKLEDIARRLNGDEKIDWHDMNQNKYAIYYNCCSDDFGQAILWTCPSPGVVYCLSKDFVQIAIKEIGARELADYITGQ